MLMEDVGIDIIGLVAARCDIDTALSLTSINRHVYQSLKPDRAKIITRYRRSRIADKLSPHIQEVSQRTVSQEGYTYYAILRPELCIKVCRAFDYQGDTVLFLPRPRIHLFGGRGSVIGHVRPMAFVECDEIELYDDGKKPVPSYKGMCVLDLTLDILETAQARRLRATA